jgi:hypothetical protein
MAVGKVGISGCALLIKETGKPRQTHAEHDLAESELAISRLK